MTEWASATTNVATITDAQVKVGFGPGCAGDASLPMTSANVNAFGVYICDEIARVVEEAKCNSPLATQAQIDALDPAATFVTACINDVAYRFPVDALASDADPVVIVCPDGFAIGEALIFNNTGGIYTQGQTVTGPLAATIIGQTGNFPIPQTGTWLVSHVWTDTTAMEDRARLVKTAC